MPRTRYTDADKAQALELYAEVGAAETARRTGISLGTIKSWASRAGLATVAADVTRAATAVSAERRRYVAEEFRTSMTETLVQIAEAAAAKELEVLAEGNVSLEKIVGARTRAIHDLQLLTGAATGRTETVTVDHLDREIESLLSQVHEHGAG